MWTREALKSNAKTFLKKFYLQAFLVALVIALVTSSSSSNSGSKSNDFDLTNDGDWAAFESVFEDGSDTLVGNVGARTVDQVSKLFPYSRILLYGIGGFFILIATLLMIAFKIFIAAPLEVGGRGFFLKGVKDDDEVSFKYLGLAFRQAHYFNVVWAMFYRGLMNFFFFLLLVIPGIVKRYAYSQVPYLLAENPEMDAREALAMSEDMTHGHKMDMFILDLSFIGWYILGLFLFGLGSYLVNPYVYATKAELYHVLRSPENGLEGYLNY